MAAAEASHDGDHDRWPESSAGGPMEAPTVATD